jgi:hypothetical protein
VVRRSLGDGGQVEHAPSLRCAVLETADGKEVQVWRCKRAECAIAAVTKVE